MARSQKTWQFPKRADDLIGIYEPDRALQSLWTIDWKAEKLPYCGVYVISPDNLYPCKIGVSTSPMRRVAALQTALWRPIQVSGYRWCLTVPEATRVERRAHKILLEEGRGLLGEWFDIRPERGLEVIEWAALTLGIELREDIPTEEMRKRLEDYKTEVSNAGLLKMYDLRTSRS